MYSILNKLFGKKKPAITASQAAMDDQEQMPPVAPAKPAPKPLIPPAPLVFEGVDAVQVIVAVVNLVLSILTILKVLDPLIFWTTYTASVMVCLGLYVIEWKSTVWEGLTYVLGFVPIIMFILGMTVPFKMIGGYAVLVGMAEMALVALYQWPVAKWLEK